MNIAVFMPNWIGDAVMATPAVRALRRHFHASRIVSVLKPYVAEVFSGSPWFDQQVLFDPNGHRHERMPSVIRQLRRLRIEVAVLLPNSFRSAWVAWLSWCRFRVGYTRYGRSLLLTDPLDVERDSRGRSIPSPVLDAYNRLALHVGCHDVDRRMELFTTDEEETAADTVWKESRFRPGSEVICLNPGAAFGAAKHWPVGSFARLARMIRQERNSNVLVLSGPRERELARAIVDQAGGGQVASLADHPVSIGLTKACVRRSNLLITTDSGPRHFATAFDRPVVTLFGPTHIAWTETFHPLGLHLQKQVPCGPCQQRICPLDHRCMTSLGAQEVFDAATRLLDRTRANARPAMVG